MDEQCAADDLRHFSMGALSPRTALDASQYDKRVKLPSTLGGEPFLFVPAETKTRSRRTAFRTTAMLDWKGHSFHTNKLITGLGLALPKALDDGAALFDLVVGRNLKESARLFTAIDPGKAIEVLPHPWVTVF